ncbi:hypothetical protein INT45_001694 [Circinella minor]|uniref:Uncharacterized protein n=1 Tax=Circinella minor TaxID=1195481 RepID=A0A8H7VLS6_9FUNG|nr:hypothetical protein INT45_001694 [Circinella minor]
MTSPTLPLAADKTGSVTSAASAATDSLEASGDGKMVAGAQAAAKKEDVKDNCDVMVAVVGAAADDDEDSKDSGDTVLLAVARAAAEDEGGGLIGRTSRGYSDYALVYWH